jgi:uncharacterized membrane protein YgcG
MKCPSCSLPVNDTTATCPSCGFHMEAIGDKIEGLPRKSGRLIDAADVIEERYTARIWNLLLDFTSRTGVEFYIVTVPSSGKVKPLEYVFYFLNHYTVGGPRHRGIVLMLFEKERVIACEVGYSLERIITDEAANDVLTRDAAPLCAKGEYGKALYTAALLLTDVLANGKSRVKRFFRTIAGFTGKERA